MTPGKVEVQGDIETIREYIASLFEKSGFEVRRSGEATLRIRKVRLAPSRRIPLLFYGRGVVNLVPQGEHLTKVVYDFSTSPVSLFSFVLTGFSIIVFAVFVDYFLLVSAGSLSVGMTVELLVTNAVVLSTIPILIIAFLRTRERAERFFRASLQSLV